MVIVLAALLIIFAAAAAFSQYRARQDIQAPSVTDPDSILLVKRRLIEAQYPEFRDFESQESFAGKAVEHAQAGYDFYFAYETLGSGLPIAQATCFRVDHAGRVFKIGEFPDPLDSYAGYPAVDPVTCKGKKEK